MNLISVKLRKRLAKKTLVIACESVLTLSDPDHKDIYRTWFSAKETKSESRKVAAYVTDA